MALHLLSARARAFCVMSLAAFAATGVTRQVTRTAQPAQRDGTSQTQQAQTQFGGSYSTLDPRRQKLVDNWVGRFNVVSGQHAEPGPFYDTILSLSTRTTFDAVTHALKTSPLTDASGVSLGDGLDLIERLDSVAGRIEGAGGDLQFRIYVRLKEGAVDMLDRSQEFKRERDNTVYHKGYPLNYREQGGAPSIQVSVSLDRRNADIDVDYRSSSFPIFLLNGHLSAANSDVRASNNVDRHNGRWAGLRSWWRSFFGVPVGDDADKEVPDTSHFLPNIPRAGEKNIEVMVHDFLDAWLVEGNIVAAMGYVSERACACLAEDRDDPATLDRGMAPFVLMNRLKAAHEAVGPRKTLEGLTVGVRLSRPELKVVTQPYHAQFVIYSVPDDVALSFDCESRLTPGDPKKVRRVYGNYFGAAFYVNGQTDHQVALLWAKDGGYWKIVSWQTDVEEKGAPVPHSTPEVKIATIPADPTLVDAARSFLESWLIRKNYDQAFRYLSPSSYACYDLLRGPDQPAATSPEDAGRRIRAGLERVGNQVGKARSLDALVSAADPVHPAVRLMDHQYSNTFTLVSLPNAFAQVSGCDVRARAERVTGDMPPEYGTAFGMNIRFLTLAGEGAVLRVLWLKELGAWRIAAYDVELP